MNEELEDREIGDPNAGNLHDKLREVYSIKQAEIASKWHRTLPFGEYIVDRWEKAELLGFAEGVSIYDSAIVLEDVTVGENTWIGPFTILDGTGPIDWVMVFHSRRGPDLYPRFRDEGHYGWRGGL